MGNTKKIELINGKNIEMEYDRSLYSILEFTKCHLTNEETWCICIDTSDGEYGTGKVSIKYINEKLNNYLKNNEQ